MYSFPNILSTFLCLAVITNATLDLHDVTSISKLITEGNANGTGSFPFTGYDVTKEFTTDWNSTDLWHYEFSVTQVNDTSRGETVIPSFTVIPPRSLVTTTRDGEDQKEILMVDRSWSLCQWMTVLRPTTEMQKYGAPNVDGSCTGFLSEACIEDWVHTVASRVMSGGCLSPMIFMSESCLGDGILDGQVLTNSRTSDLLLNQSISSFTDAGPWISGWTADTLSEDENYPLYTLGMNAILPIFLIFMRSNTDSIPKVSESICTEVRPQLFCLGVTSVAEGSMDVLSISIRLGMDKIYFLGAVATSVVLLVLMI